MAYRVAHKARTGVLRQGTPIEEDLPEREVFRQHDDEGWRLDNLPRQGREMVDPRPFWETSHLLIPAPVVVAALLHQICNPWFDLARLQPGGQVEHGGTA